MSVARDVFWLVAPLSVYQHAGVTKILGRVRKSDPEHYRFLTWAQHWAIEIGEYCYELHATEENRFSLDIKGVESKVPDKLKEVSHAVHKVTAKIELRIVAAKEWHRFWDDQHPPVHIDKHKVGQTLWDPDHLAFEAHRFWTDYCREDYDLMVRNCQDFAYGFCQKIKLQPGQLRMSREEQDTWTAMDEPVGHILAAVYDPLTRTRLTWGTTHLFGAALSEIAFAGGFEGLIAAESVAGAATTGAGHLATGGTAGAHAVSGAHAVGGAVETVHLGEAVFAANSGSAATIGSAAAHAGQAAAAGASHGAMGAALAKGGALSAKGAVVGLKGAGATKLGIIGKAGAAAACAHPVTGAIIVGSAALNGWFYHRKNREAASVKRSRDVITRNLQRVKEREQYRASGDSDGLLRWIEKAQGILKDIGGKTDTAVSRFDLEDLMYGLMRQPDMPLERLEVDELREALDVEGDMTTSE